MREQPGKSAVDRLKESLVKYGVLPSSDLKPSDEQVEIEAAFDKRVSALKGIHTFSVQTMMTYDAMIIFCT